MTPDTLWALLLVPFHEHDRALVDMSSFDNIVEHSNPKNATEHCRGPIHVDRRHWSGKRPKGKEPYGKEEQQGNNVDE